jgi:cytochrome P450
VKFDPSVMADPFPFYEKLREAGPVHRMTLPHGRSVWLVTRYQDARAALADPRLSLDKATATPGSWPGFGLPPAMDRNLLNMDPPDHTRIRRLVSQAFTARRVESNRIQAVVDVRLDALASLDQVDLIRELAIPVPLRVICDLIGVEPEDRQDFRAWTDELVASETGRPADVKTAVGNILRYFVTLIARKRANPGDDLTSALIAARDEHDRLTEDELVGLSWLTLVAGTENTARAMANGILTLLTHPAQLAALRADPALLPSGVEELLRYDGPAQHAIRRFAREDITIGDVTIPAGDAVLVAVASADRDPGRFPEPDRLDLARADNPHLAFGNGIHYCFGAPLARLQIQITIAALIERFPDLALAVPVDQLRWQLSFRARDLLELPVTLKP